MLKKSIYQTLAYYNIQEFPLILDEIQTFLWKKKASKEEITHTLQSLPHIGGKEGFFYLETQHNIVAKRKHKKSLSDKLWKKCNFYLQFLQAIPFIKMVGVANNLAFDNPHKESDIDLLIIIEKRRLWMTRLLITAVLHIMGVRRHHNKIQGRFCLSFFLTEEFLDLSELMIHDDDIYLIYWIANMKPVIDNDMYKNFIQKNSHILNKYLPNFSEKNNVSHIIPPHKLFQLTNKCLTWLFQGKLGDIFEKRIKNYLKPRALNKAKKLGNEASVLIKDTILKFHNIDKRASFYDAWQKEVKKYI